MPMHIELGKCIEIFFIIYDKKSLFDEEVYASLALCVKENPTP
jgi:hypothetical protein